MAANYLHGVETVKVKSGSRPVRVIRTSVIALVGIAPVGPVNQLTLVLNDTDAAEFGEKLPGFTIPQALDAIFKQGPATVLVVNTFDAENNVTAVPLETKTITNGRLKLDVAPIGDVQIFEQDGVTPSDLVKDVDYSLDAFGNFRALSANAAEGTVLKFTYNKLNTGSVTASQIIGTVNAAGVRTGLKLLDLAFPMFGFNPKLIIAPGHTGLAGVPSEMQAAANKFRGHYVLDAPIGKTPAEVVAARGPAGTIEGFNTSSERAVLCYPHVKVYDAATDTEVLQPLSQFFAGVVSAVDLNEGYHVSPSNHEIVGITGMERTITAAINNPNTEANLLNENGIVTLFSGFGTGIRLWGNRSAAWPTNTAPENFVCVQRVADILNESVELAMLPFIDQPINDAIIDSIRETVNAFIRTLIGRGALIDGLCYYNPADNPPEEIALGHITFGIDFMPPTPAERITFKSFIDINLLRAVGTQQ